MWSSSFSPRRLLPAVFGLLSTLPASVLAGDQLSSTGYSICYDNPDIHVDRLNVTYNRNTRLITFDVAGESTVQLNVTVDLVVTAYGQQVYTRSFNPCDVHDMNMPQICPLPATTFAAAGSEIIPEQYASQIPSIAFNIPDLDGLVQLTLHDSTTGQEVGCIQSAVSNGHSFQMPVVQYTAAGVAATALVFSAAGAVAGVGGGAHGGGSATSPSFGETIGWFQGMATSGMLSVAYPKVYQSFTTNFAFSTGLVSWSGFQTAIDNFRQATGGNLTDASYQYLKNNASLMYYDGSMNTTLRRRDATMNVNGTSLSMTGDGNSTSVSLANGTTAGNATDQPLPKSEHFVKGLEAYVEQLSIPKANTFMTVLLVWACVVGAIIVLILMFKIILEICSMWGNLPKSLESWRKRYWWRMAKALTNLILMLYGVWTLYCIYQFTNGDSWAAKALAGVTLGLFTAVLVGFTWKIYSKVHEGRKAQGDGKNLLFEDKDTWVRYSLFYDSYKQSYWWLFVPVIVYMFARGCIIAGFNGHGLYQAAGQLIVEGLMLVLLIWARPYQRPSSQWINITIQTVRVVSVGCVLLFVEELGISQTTKTITGVVLIVVQCVLTGVLAILIAVNTLIGCIKENPHRRRRKEQEQARLDRDLETLTSLDPNPRPRSSFIMDAVPTQYTGPDEKHPAFSAAPVPSTESRGRYDPVRDRSPSNAATLPPMQRMSRFGLGSRHGHLVQDSRDEGTGLMAAAAGMGHRRDESVSRSPPRYPGAGGFHRPQMSTVSSAYSTDWVQPMPAQSAARTQAHNGPQPRLPEVGGGGGFGQAM